jgi:hypothetical protein
MTLEPGAHALTPLIAQIEAGLAALPGGRQGFVLTLESDEDDDVWVQVSDGLINAAWPFEHEPEPLFPALGASSQVAFEAGVYATFAMPEAPTGLLARWIAHYFVEILGCDPAVELTAAVEDHN